MDLVKVAISLAKRAEQQPLNPLAAAGAGMFGPLGTSLYEGQTIENPKERWGVVGRSALGGAIGGGIGWLAGVPVSLATSIPILPTMAGGVLGSIAGGAVGAHRGAKRYNAEFFKQHPSKKRKSDEH